MQQFSILILDSFKEDELRKVLRFELDVGLDDVVKPNEFGIRVFDLLEWASKNGRLVELAKALSKERQYRPDLKDFALALESGSAAESVECSFCPHKSLSTISTGGRDVAGATKTDRGGTRSGGKFAVTSSPFFTGSDVLATDLPKPPAVPKNAPEDDPNRGRFGRKSERDGRALSAKLVKEYEQTFVFDLSVSATDGNPLAPPAIFFLHDTYPKPSYHIYPVRDDGLRIVFAGVEAWGTYTVGAQVRKALGGWTQLEYDLTDLSGLSAKFVGR